MNLADRSRATLGIGLLALWMTATDAMLKYLRPSMRPWLFAGAVSLIAVGIYGLVRERQLAASHSDDHDRTHHRRGSRTGWLLVVPIIVVILFGPQPMGDYAVTRTPNLPPFAFDIAAYATSTGERSPHLKVRDVIGGATQPGNRDYLLTHDVVLLGFVSKPYVQGDGSFLMTRFLISCCAADAQPLNVQIVGTDTVPPKNQWVTVTARLQPHLAGRDPVLKAKRIELTDAPSSPYESLR